MAMPVSVPLTTLPPVSPNITYTGEVGVMRISERRSRAGVRPFKYSCKLHMFPSNRSSAHHRTMPPYPLRWQESMFGIRCSWIDARELFLSEVEQYRMMAKPLSIQRCEAKCSGHCVSGRTCENLRLPDVRVVVHFTQCWWFSTAHSPRRSLRLRDITVI